MTVIVMTELKRALEQFVKACDNYPSMHELPLPPGVDRWIKDELNPANIMAREALAMPPKKDPDKI